MSTPNPAIFPGSAALYCGDCIEVMRGIDDNIIDMILADIPYGEVNRPSGGLRNLNKGIADEVTFPLESALRECLRLCAGSIYIFCGIDQVSEIRATFSAAGLSTRLGVWEKTNPSPMNGQHIWLSSVECCVYGKRRGASFNEHCQGSVWRHSAPRGKLHPTMKPVGLMERLILASSNEGETVLDFTMGSGTTGVAAANTGRKFIGIERDPEYFRIAEERIGALNGY